MAARSFFAYPAALESSVCSGLSGGKFLIRVLIQSDQSSSGNFGVQLFIKKY
jgi:hypothetical protein